MTNNEEKADSTLNRAVAIKHCKGILQQANINVEFEDLILQELVERQNIILGYVPTIQEESKLKFIVKLHKKYQTPGFRLVVVEPGKKRKDVVWGYLKCINDVFPIQRRTKTHEILENTNEIQNIGYKVLPPGDFDHKCMRELIWRRKRLLFLKTHASFVILRYHKTAAHVDDVNGKDYTKSISVVTPRINRRVPVAECGLCNQITKVAVDHFPTSFKQIAEEFIISMQECLSTNMKKLTKVHWKRAWIKFHEARASFRLLCKSCNSKCGCYGYK